MLSLRALFLALAALAVSSAAEAQQFPESIERSCRGGRAKIYDECGSQAALLNQALAAAEASGKVVLVVYGAEWCIWCHVFDQYIQGKTDKFTYRVENDTFRMSEPQKADKQAAADLADFVQRTFVIAHLEDQYSPDGWQALQSVGVTEITGLPHIFTLKNGRIAAAMRWEEELPGIEISIDEPVQFRGFDRAVLLAELQRLAKKAR